MGKIKILIKDIHENVKKVEVDSLDTIGNGKKVYLLNTNYSNNNFSCRWYFQGIILEDDKTFSDYEIGDGDMIIQNDLLKTPLPNKEEPKPNRFNFDYKCNYYDKFIEKSKKRVKQFFICDVVTDETKELNIGVDKTVKELKKEIEKLFNLSYSLDDLKLKVKYPGMKNGKAIGEEDENKTLFALNFKSESYILFGRESNKG